MEWHRNFRQEEIPRVVNIQFSKFLSRGNLAECLPMGPANSRREVWDWGDYLDISSREAGKVSCALINKDPVQGLDSIRKQTRECKYPHAPAPKSKSKPPKKFPGSRCRSFCQTPARAAPRKLSLANSFRQPANLPGQSNQDIMPYEPKCLLPRKRETDGLRCASCHPN